MSAERAAVGNPLPFDAGEQRGIERIALRTVTALARAGTLPLVGNGAFARVLWHQLRDRAASIREAAAAGQDFGVVSAGSILLRTK